VRHGLTLWVVAVAAWASLVSPVFGQDSPVPSKVERKNLAPVSPDTLRVKLPKPVEATLSTGLRVLLVEDHRLPHVLAEFHIRGAGSLFDPDHLPGLASATAQMLREGTAKLKSRSSSDSRNGRKCNCASNAHLRAFWPASDLTARFTVAIRPLL
jgi:hypothetical protein